MSVRNAVAQREQQPAVPATADVVNKAIERQLPRFQAVIPKGFDPARFSNLVLTAVKAKPELLECFATEKGKVSLLLAAMQAATIGLEPDTPLQEAWLLPRRIKGTMEAQLSIGYRGLLKLARRSGLVKTVFADVVREGDTFRYARGLEQDVFEHVPAPSERRGELTHAYAIIRYKDGSADFEVLDKAQVHKHRAQSDSWKGTGREYSPWTKWEDEMWAKTALRSLLKTAPLTAETASAVEADERSLALSGDHILTIDESDDATGEPLAELTEATEYVEDGEPFELQEPTS